MQGKRLAALARNQSRVFKLFVSTSTFGPTSIKASGRKQKNGPASAWTYQLQMVNLVRHLLAVLVQISKFWSDQYLTFTLVSGVLLGGFPVCAKPPKWWKSPSGMRLELSDRVRMHLWRALQSTRDLSSVPLTYAVLVCMSLVDSDISCPWHWISTWLKYLWYPPGVLYMPPATFGPSWHWSEVPVTLIWSPFHTKREYLLGLERGVCQEKLGMLICQKPANRLP